MIDLANLKKILIKQEVEFKKMSLPGNGCPPGNKDLDVNLQKVLDFCHTFASFCNCILIIKNNL
jgi:hypothetical protein